MKTTTSIIMMVLIGLFVFIGVYHWDSNNNRGYSFGYWGEYNRFADSLAQMPDIVIVDSWYHGDIGLEEFSFTIKTNSGIRKQLMISEHDPIRRLNGTTQLIAIRSEIDRLPEI